jgi:hypothetical protein
MARLSLLVAEWGEDIPYVGALANGFPFRGTRVPFLNRQKGIYRSAVQRGPAVLSIQTSANTLIIEEVLEDDSHFIVQLRRCAKCSQRFVWIFTEFVDWEGGNDPQYRDILPVTPAEAERIARQGRDVDFRWVAELGRGRRYLRTNWPSNERKQTADWASGELFITRGG